jgi:L-cysteine desulfidase
MDKNVYDKYVKVLNEELVAALGCTEPIALAYASAVARKELGAFPEKMTAICSGNMIKNVKGVTVPNSGNQKGIKAAVILGALGGNPDKKLEVLTDITLEHIEQSKQLEQTDFCQVELAEGVANLYICIVAQWKEDVVKVEILDKHTNIVNIEKNGNQLYYKDYSFNNGEKDDKYDFMDIEGIIQFAEEANLNDVSHLLEMQIEYNTRIAEEGLSKPYGTNTGKKLLDIYGDDVAIRARAMAAAGSDARMSGSDLAVVINSGSGNQGITVSLPVIEYAKELQCDIDRLYRALILSNLISIHIKADIGSLSAFCGAVSAGAGSSAGITYLLGGTWKQIKNAVSNTLAIASGMICDGAKPSCAAKVSVSIDAAIMASKMALSNENYSGGEGIIMDDVEDTVDNVGRLGREGMKETDIEILKMMIG